MYKNELSRLIKKRGYNPLQLAKRFNYSPSVVYNWTYGIREPSAYDMLRLATVLQVPVETIVRIFGGVND
jgi:transcriptional regulator with XRE-family HTH domain